MRALAIITTLVMMVVMALAYAGQPDQTFGGFIEKALNVKAGEFKATTTLLLPEEALRFISNDPEVDPGDVEELISDDELQGKVLVVVSCQDVLREVEYIPEISLTYNGKRVELVESESVMALITKSLITGKNAGMTLVCETKNSGEIDFTSKGVLVLKVGDMERTIQLPYEPLYATIPCPECGYLCSGAWKWCPGCGADLTETPEELDEEEETVKNTISEYWQKIKRKFKKK